MRPAYLFILPWPLKELGGVNQVVFNLTREISKSGTFDPMVLVLDWSAVNPVYETISELKIIRWRIRPYAPSMTVKERIIFSLWEIRFRRRFERLCIEYKVAVINPHYPGPWVFSLSRAVEKFRTRRPLILSFHGTDVTNLRHAPPVVISEWRRLLYKIDGIIVCSKNLGYRLQAIFGEDLIYHVIYNGIDVVNFTKTKRLPKTQTARIILSIGTFLENKGHDVTINAFSSISSDYADVKLVLLGVVGPALNHLRELCAEKGVEDRVIFHLNVPHSQVADFYREATLFILASRQEAFPIVLLEAGAFGLPVIASDVGGIPELLTDGFNGILISADDPKLLALKLRSLLDHPATAAEMGTNLRDHIQSKFTWRTSARLYIILATGKLPRSA